MALQVSCTAYLDSSPSSMVPFCSSSSPAVLLFNLDLLEGLPMRCGAGVVEALRVKLAALLVLLAVSNTVRFSSSLFLLSSAKTTGKSAS